MSSPALVDCLVVGAGPVGLLVAAELAFRGCSVRIVDRLEEPNPHSRASLVQARSLEVLPAEVTDKILHNGHRIGGVTIFEAKPGQAKAEVLTTLDTQPIEGYHMLFSEKQWETERYLTEYLSSLPDLHRGGAQQMRIERGIELVSFNEHDTGIEATLRHVANGKTETVAARFLVGCDGARSNVRRQLGVHFEGAFAAELFVAVDAAIDGGVFNKDVVNVISGSGTEPEAKGMAYSVPFEDGNSLVILDIDASLQDRFNLKELGPDGLPALRQPEPKEVVDLLRKRGCGPDLHFRPGSVKWVGVFRVFSRQADHYGRGRIFLAGDACHCHSPLGGQGMNMGLQGAKNLAWKIALVAKGAGPPLLLDTYEAERHGLEKKLLHAIQVGQAAVSSGHPLSYFLHGQGRRLVGLFDGMMASALKYASQQGWSYRDSPLSQEHWERPPLTLCPITTVCPFGGYRRRQNFRRWLATRVHAGDRVPNVRLAAGTCHGPQVSTLHQVLKRSKGFTLMLFEGSKAGNEDMRRHVRGSQILDLQGLHSFGESLRGRPDAAGFVATVDEIVVFPSTDAAHETFGVYSQSLFLVRPDHHVGFRCEPLRRGAVVRYFREACGLSLAQVEDAPPSSPSFDWLPAAVWSALALGLAGALTAQRCGALEALQAKWR